MCVQQWAQPRKKQLEMEKTINAIPSLRFGGLEGAKKAGRIRGPAEKEVIVTCELPTERYFQFAK